MRLIDADPLLDELISRRWIYNVARDTRAVTIIRQIMADIERTPTIDAVEVIRCEECRWWKSIFSWSGQEHKVCVREGYEPTRKPTDYCSYGEKNE